MNDVHTSPAPTRLSRETRHLLMAATIALVLLWVLARVRFPDRPASPNPITPLMTQLSGRLGFSDLASEIARAHSRLSGSLLALPSPPSVNEGAVALRLRGDTAIVLMSPARRAATNRRDIVASDRATNLTILKVPAGSPVLGPAPWAPDRVEAPRYLLAATGAPDGAGVALRPVFVGMFQPATSPAWSGPVWRVPPSIDATPGTWLFSPEGELAGLVVADGGVSVVPGETLITDAARLADRGAVSMAGTIGVLAQGLTPALATATGAKSGVVVTFVDPRGPAASRVAVGDVVEMFSDVPVTSVGEWNTWTARLVPHEQVELAVRRRGELQRIPLTAVAPPAPVETPLGLTLRWVVGLGTEVLAVDDGSAASVAGLRRGDVVTAVGATARPTPVQIRRAFAAVKPGESLVVGIARDDRHRVTALGK
jgi:S1-C subfamily serine protease